MVVEGGCVFDSTQAGSCFFVRRRAAALLSFYKSVRRLDDGRQAFRVRRHDDGRL
jgi:hypothetical protein